MDFYTVFNLNVRLFIVCLSFWGQKHPWINKCRWVWSLVWKSWWRPNIYFHRMKYVHDLNSTFWMLLLLLIPLAFKMLFVCMPVWMPHLQNFSEFSLFIPLHFKNALVNSLPLCLFYWFNLMYLFFFYFDCSKMYFFSIC